MVFLIDLYKGKFGLATTYWGWGVLGGALVALGSFISVYVATKNVNNPLLYDVIINGYLIFLISWSIFICIAIINSASYNRERGLWGWIASIIAIIGIVRALMLTATSLGFMSLSWSDIEKGMIVQNMGLPVEVDKGLTLIKISTNSDDKSVVNYFRFDYETLNSDTFDTQIAQKNALESCEDYKSFLEGPVKKIVFKMEANDGTQVVFNISREDCGF